MLHGGICLEAQLVLCSALKAQRSVVPPDYFFEDVVCFSVLFLYWLCVLIRWAFAVWELFFFHRSQPPYSPETGGHRNLILFFFFLEWHFSSKIASYQLCKWNWATWSIGPFKESLAKEFLKRVHILEKKNVVFMDHFDTNEIPGGDLVIELSKCFNSYGN